MTTFVALLRGVNVGGHRKVPMGDLRDVAKGLGWQQIATYVASGNLVFQATGDAGQGEADLEVALLARFGFPVDVVVRTSKQWRALRDGNPFAEASRGTPNFVMACIGKANATDADHDTLRGRAAQGEHVALVDGNLWLHYGNGSGRSKMAFKATEGVWTTRNWNTVEQLAKMCANVEE